MIHRHRWLLFVAGLLIFCSALLFLYYNILLPNAVQKAEAKVRRELDENAMPRVKVAVIDEKSRIAKYTELTDALISQKVRIVDMPVRYAAAGVLGDISLLRGKITREDLEGGEQILAESLTTDKKWFGDEERLREFPLGSIVAGEVKDGNIIDITVNYGDGTYDVVVPKIKVRKLISHAASADNSAGGSSYTVVVAVDEVQYRDLMLATEAGQLESRLYLDESQPPSTKTFAYSSVRQKLAKGQLLPAEKAAGGNALDTQYPPIRQGD